MSPHPGGSLVRARRATAYRNRRDGVAASVEHASAALARVDADLADLLEVVTRKVTARRARIRRIHQHTHRRLAAYRRWLIRYHRGGGRLNAILEAVEPRLPVWAAVPWPESATMSTVEGQPATG